MKCSILVVLALVGSSACAPYGGMVNTGHSAQYREDDGHGNYEFGYNEDHATGGTFRKEKGGPGYQEGSYGLRDADGRMRIVHYIADAHGFRATISTNEPGVDPHQSPASTSINSAHAPLLESHSAVAPVAVAPKAYAEQEYSAPSYSAPLHSEPAYSAPLHQEPVPYSAPVHPEPAHPEPLYTESSHNEPMYGQRLSYGLNKGYGAVEEHFAPALSNELMANAYQAPILKSAYVPDYESSEYASLPNGHYGAGSALYHKQQYPGYY